MCQCGRGTQAEGRAGPWRSRAGEKRVSIAPSRLDLSPGLLGWEVSYFFGFLGEISMAGPGAGMSMGNMSTHISRRPCKVGEVQSAPLVPPVPLPIWQCSPPQLLLPFNISLAMPDVGQGPQH